MPGRFNHMELTLPDGELNANRKEIAEFYGNLFGWDSIDVPILGQTGLLLRESGSQPLSWMIFSAFSEWSKLGASPACSPSSCCYFLVTGESLT